MHPGQQEGKAEQTDTGVGRLVQVGCQCNSVNTWKFFGHFYFLSENIIKIHSWILRMEHEILEIRGGKYVKMVINSSLDLVDHNLKTKTFKEK